ncbi:MAG: MBL fold metallo-hydrolase, partial [Nanoarchaeota archaeon]|nr:MBL fold metallo-hydrolase [Nanoarchaeota archaeon]
MVPTKERNVSGLYLEYKGEGILFDCGEGTQRQMNITGIKRTNVRKILVSHWHGDHVSGIIGLIQTMGNNDNPPKLSIYGPKETKKRVEHLMQTCIFDNRVEIDIHELTPKDGEVLVFFENEEYRLECARLDHGVPCIGFSFIEKERLNIDTAKQKKLGIPDGPHLRKIKNGEDITYKEKKITPAMLTYKVERKKITYVADTLICDGAMLLAQDSDVLICESAFSSEHQEKAEERK